MPRLPDHNKQNGVHYTPDRLASFLARAILSAGASFPGPVNVLDPACGDGGLLRAFASEAPKSMRARLRLHGYDRDAAAVAIARDELRDLGVDRVVIHHRDFLNQDTLIQSRGGGKDSPEAIEIETPRFDIVIANPPYVRTQVMGAAESQRLGQLFGITGRVDLYHAFSIAMSRALRNGGFLGLLTSNRFLTVKSGVTMRRYLDRHYDLKTIFDLGDTRLFRAAVLPAVIIAEKRDVAAQPDVVPETDDGTNRDRGQRRNPERNGACEFVRVYEQRPSVASVSNDSTDFVHLLDAVEEHSFTGLAETASGIYQVERGALHRSGNEEVWSLANEENRVWMKQVETARRYCFNDVAQIRVGIKTTADRVFIRDEWESIPQNQRPEASLIHPLITHHCAERWALCSEKLTKTVLYPHESIDGVKSVVNLDHYPRAESYLTLHRQRLASRKYVQAAGREWFEIWVPQDPSQWSRKKIVFPDIAERPTFFLDESGSIVNGDCYWITTRPGFSDDWLYLTLAVANSSFIAEYYDVAFHNKLYAGRRRFMTQYVKEFPLPDLQSSICRQIVSNVRTLTDRSSPQPDDRLESETEDLVWSAFGLPRLGRRHP